MATRVNDLLLDAVANAPGAFHEKDLALDFLRAEESVDAKMERAAALLGAAARSGECEAAWSALVTKHLKPTEEAMRILLPKHRDHIIHSAHLYLLGVAIYLKMLRPDVVLLTVAQRMSP